MAEIILAGGCFWGVEEYFRRTEGITATVVGYINSDIPNPTYEDLCYGKSKAAEGVIIEFDDEVISREKLWIYSTASLTPTATFAKATTSGANTAPAFIIARATRP